MIITGYALIYIRIIFMFLVSDIHLHTYLKEVDNNSRFDIHTVSSYLLHNNIQCKPCLYTYIAM